MTIPWKRGVAIPDEGTDVVVPVCIQDTWIPVIRGLLVQPTKPYFWANNANPEDVEYATKTAETILATFNTEDCACNPESGTIHQDTWDFSVSDGGFQPIGPNYGTYADGKWNCDLIELSPTRWDMRLEIYKDYSPAVIPFEQYATMFVNDESTAHISASYGWVAGWNSYNRALGEVQYGGSLTGWHTGAMNPRYVVYTQQGVTRIILGMRASYALSPENVVTMYASSATFRYFG